ncbi:MAG TPA: amidohydrolase family protein [Gemmatimonadales bacterium]|nr:amidohydrolase family protein [Gemmatimonadales bacterium]
MDRTSRIFTLAALVTLGACAAPAPRPARIAPREAEPAIAIVNATLWDGTGRGPVPNAVTLVRGDRILCAGAAAECVAPRDARIIDAHGGWLIPGLIDTHVHLLFLERGSAGEELAADLKDLLAQGITSVRDMGTNPAELLSRTHALSAAPRVYAMQLVAGLRFFYERDQVQLPDGSVALRMPQAQAMEARGWSPMMFTHGDNADSLVAEARKTGAIGLKLYAYFDSATARALVDAAHRAGISAWGHAWVQPANPGELVRAGEDGIVHASLLVGDLLSGVARDRLLASSAILTTGASLETPEAAHDPRIGATLDTMARRGTFLEPTLDVTLRSQAHFDGVVGTSPSLPAEFAHASVGFSMAVTREAVRRGVRITAGTDHVAYGPARDRASLVSELRLLVDSIGLSPAAALTAATRDAARAIGGEPARTLGTIEAGRYADLVLLDRNPLADIRNVESVEWVMQGGMLWHPWQLRSGIASAEPPATSGAPGGD